MAVLEISDPEEFFEAEFITPIEVRQALPPGSGQVKLKPGR
jgi:hypothetical protein